MSFDRNALSRALEAHGPVCRVVVAEARGSTPRDAGAAMLVWAGGQHGTIGGGALEHEAAATAREMLAQRDANRLSSQPLGPALGQCCGGAVTLLWEVFETADLPEGDIPDVYLRPVTRDAPREAPGALTRLARGVPEIALQDGWCAERIGHPAQPVWIFGGGHVGRAVAAVLAPLPDFEVTLIDTDAGRLPDPLPEGVTPLVAANPVQVVPHAPANAHHLVMTYSHALDLDLCHALLGRTFAGVGLIGSATKWARFRKRLAALGHRPGQIARIACPIGDPALGKHPHQIAVGVAARLLKLRDTAARPEEIAS